MLAPVVLFVYNRPNHTLRTLEALEKNEGSLETILYVYADGLKTTATEEQKLAHKKVKEVLLQKKWCKEIHITESETNLGLAKSVVKGVTEVVERHGKVIVLEDDIVTSNTFLSFMNASLEKYEKEETVSCISGYIYPIKNINIDSFFIKGADCWGWSTWARAWKKLNLDAAYLYSEIISKNLSYDFNFNETYPYTLMLNAQKENKINSWAICWYASAYLENMYALYPSKSLVWNIGVDGSGIHSGTSDVWGEKTENFMPALPNVVEENFLAKSEISKFFLSLKTTNKTNNIFSKIKNLLKWFLK